MRGGGSNGWRVTPPPGAARERACGHLDLALAAGPAPGGCGPCLAAGRTWVNLLVCLVCGEVGCCDSSAGRHAHAHAERTGHPLARTLKDGEDWGWCYVDEVFLEPAPERRFPAS